MNIKYKLIDVSAHNGDIDFQKVKSDGVDGVIIRGGYGVSTTDKNFHKNIQNAIKNNLHIGVYWFGYAYSETLAEKEAKYCLSVIDKYKGNIDLPIFYDWEYDSFNYAKNTGKVIPTKTKISNWTEKFCNTIEKAGYFVGVYANLDYLNNYYTSHIKNRYTIWVAQWSKRCTYSGNYGIWQYGAETNLIDNKTIKGISGIVDKNYCYIDYPSIITSKGLNGYPTTKKNLGDINNDGIIDNDDVNILKEVILGINNNVDKSTMDLNNDNEINIVDLLELKKKLPKE